MSNVFRSYIEAREKARIWKLAYPDAKFDIRQIACGNRVGWEVVQTNRFGD